MLLQPELQLIFNILKHEVTQSNECSILLQPASSTLNWDYFLQLAIRHRIVIQAYNYFKDSDYIPKKYFSTLSNLCQKIKMQNLNMLGETIKITRELAKHDIKYIILKGLPLAQIAYGNYANRQAKDIDILVNPEDLEKAQNIILNLGFKIKYPTYALEGFKKSYYLMYQHEIILYNPFTNVEVELHFNLNYVGIKFFNFNDIPEHRININNHSLTTTMHVYHLIYLILHGSIHAFSRLRWLHDIALYIINTDVDLKKVFVLAKLLNIEHIMLQTLLLIQQIYGLQNPLIDEIILINKSKKSQHLASSAMEFIVADYELSNNNGLFNRMFFKYRLYLVRLSIHKINVLTSDLFKIEKTFSYITMPKYLSFGYYLFYPFIAVKYLRK